MPDNPPYLVDRPIGPGDVALILRANGEVHMLGSDAADNPTIAANFTKIMALYAAVMRPEIMAFLGEELEAFIAAGHLKLPEAKH